jgi:hypothetical protein
LSSIWLIFCCSVGQKHRGDPGSSSQQLHAHTQWVTPVWLLLAEYHTQQSNRRYVA